MKYKDVLVTGATGRIGSNLIKVLLGKGYHVKAFAMPDDTQLQKLSSMKVDIVFGSLQDYRSIFNAVREVDAIIHLAALMGIPNGMPRQEYFDINVRGTLNVLEASVQSCTVKKLIFSSTDATYPISKRLYSPVDENHPQRPDSLYGLTKVICEKMCLEYATEYGLPATILRYGFVSAPPEIITNVLRDSDQKLRVWINSEDKPWKVHASDVRDIVEGTILALEKKSSENEVFNLLGAAIFAYDEAVEYAASLLGEKYKTDKQPTCLSYEADLSKARGALGYKPKYNVFRMIEDSVKYLRGEDVGVIPSTLFNI